MGCGKTNAGKKNFEQIPASGYPLIYVGFRRIGGFDKQAILRALKEHPTI